MDGLNFTEQPRILVVDDTPDNLALMSSLLRDKYRVTIANNGVKALQIAASSSPPDLILLDIMMPGMDGYEVCEQLKHDPKTANIPVIFLTGTGDEAAIEKGLDLGGEAYVVKPFHAITLVAQVKEILSRAAKN